MAIIPLVDVIGAAGAALTTLCWLPQARKVIREKETRALSLPATAAFTLGLALWLIYGLAIDDWPLIGSNAATLVPMAVILTMKLRYG
jgi:MtN3 and saliva related transmembrane protein